MSRFFPINTLHQRLFNKFIPILRSYRYILSPNVKIAKGVRIGSRVLLKNWNGGKIIIGKRTCIEDNAMLLSMGGDIIIGDDSTVNPFTIIYGQGGCRIGNGVRIAAHCTIIPSNHQFQDISRPIFEQGLINKGIVIEDDVWIGTGVRILDGVRIASGCVIGAGSVVTKSTEPNGVYVGVPAHKK
jgi:acetyltransferase-like isoleucine patch superfamily enzyme